MDVRYNQFRLGNFQGYSVKPATPIKVSSFERNPQFYSEDLDFASMLLMCCKASSKLVTSGLNVFHYRDIWSKYKHFLNITCNYSSALNGGEDRKGLKFKWTIIICFRLFHWKSSIKLCLWSQYLNTFKKKISWTTFSIGITKPRFNAKKGCVYFLSKFPAVENQKI
jgi:hypothetical protein